MPMRLPRLASFSNLGVALMIAMGLALGAGLGACGDNDQPGQQLPDDGDGDDSGSGWNPPVIESCPSCGAGQMCVQLFDGTCGGQASCQPRMLGSVDCLATPCDPACEDAYCPMPYQCEIQSPCAGETKSAFRCYGP